MTWNKILKLQILDNSKDNRIVFAMTSEKRSKGNEEDKRQSNLRLLIQKKRHIPLDTETVSQIFIVIIEGNISCCHVSTLNLGDTTNQTRINRAREFQSFISCLCLPVWQLLSIQLSKVSNDMPSACHFYLPSTAQYRAAIEPESLSRQYSIT